MKPSKKFFFTRKQFTRFTGFLLGIGNLVKEKFFFTRFQNLVEKKVFVFTGFRNVVKKGFCFY